MSHLLPAKPRREIFFSDTGSDLLHGKDSYGMTYIEEGSLSRIACVVRGCAGRQA
ncbi:MAG: hypothetical protein AAF620_12610 [Bacteroidota bacterium]